LELYETTGAMNAFWDIKPYFYPIGKSILFSQIYFKKYFKENI
jgi:hypothetical protein